MSMSIINFECRSRTIKQLLFYAIVLASILRLNSGLITQFTFISLRIRIEDMSDSPYSESHRAENAG